MTETLVADYAFDRPDPAALASVGYVGVMRYLCVDNDQTHRKILFADEAAALHAAGLSIGLVWEWYTSRAGEGHGAGAQDAQWANDQADALGVPSDRPIYYAVDYDASPDAVRPYFEGAQSIGRRPVGVYGGINVTENVDVPYRWQTEAWSHGAVGGRSNLFQRVGHTVPDVGGSYDENVVLSSDFGQWGGGTVTPSPAPTPSDPGTIPDVEYGSRLIVLTKPNMRGTDVQTWQGYLNQVQNAGLDKDGIYGPLSNTATETFQGQAGITVDGKVGPQTRGAMQAALSGSQPAPEPPPAPGPDVPAWPGRELKYVSGLPLMVGDDVSEWQTQMASRGWTIGVDGKYGPQSDGVCRAFQGEKGLAVDGIVGPNTWAAAWSAPVTARSIPASETVTE